MPDGFRVDLPALKQASDGVQRTLQEVGRKRVSDIDGAGPNMGHDRLAATVTDFCDRWDRGVENLTTDARAIADRLNDCVQDYESADQRAQDEFHGILERLHGDDPAAD